MLIGFMGYARAGKDTAALALPEYERLAFADALKEHTNGLIEGVIADAGIPPEEYVQMQEAPDYKERIRPLFVAVGATMRALQPTIWIDIVHQNLEWIGEGANVKITDVRYLNEVKFIQAKGGIIILVERVGVGPANDEETRSFRQVFEAEALGTIKPIYRIQNDGTVEKLHELVKAITSKIQN